MSDSIEAGEMRGPDGLFPLNEAWRRLPTIERSTKSDGSVDVSAPIYYEWQGYSGFATIDMSGGDDPYVEVSVSSYGQGWELYSEPLNTEVAEFDPAAFTDEAIRALICRAVSRFRDPNEAGVYDDFENDQEDPLISVVPLEMRLAHEVHNAPDTRPLTAFAHEVAKIIGKVRGNRLPNSHAAERILRLAIELERSQRGDPNAGR